MAAQLAAAISACLHISLSVVEILRHQVGYVVGFMLGAIFASLLWINLPAISILAFCFSLHCLSSFASSIFSSIAVDFVPRCPHCTEAERVPLRRGPSFACFHGSCACPCFSSSASHLSG